jgi:hypothetical protein
MAEEMLVAPIGADAGSAGGDQGDQGSGDQGGDQGEESPITGDQGGDDQGSGDGAEPEYELDENGEQKLDEEGNPIAKAPAPTDFKTTHAKIKAVDPKAAEVYRKTHFETQQYKKAFDTPQAAMEAKELFENYGGAEGIEELNGRAQQFASEMDAFSQGDPKFVSQLAADDPEGFAKIGVPYLAELAKTNPEAYDAALMPILNSTLNSSGITAGIIEAGNLIDGVYGALKQAGITTGLPEIAQAFQALKKAFATTENFKKLAEKSAERPLTDREKAIADREKQFTEKERETYYSEVQTKVTAASDAVIDKSLQTYFKQFPKMTKEQKADLHAGVFSYIAQQLKSDKKYGTTLRQLLDAGDQGKVANFVSQNVQRLAQASAKTVWNRRGFGKLPNTTPGAGSKNQGTVTLSAKPKYDDIDFSEGKTTEIQYMSGEAVLKGSGKKVKWSWDRV